MRFILQRDKITILSESEFRACWHLAAYLWNRKHCNVPSATLCCTFGFVFCHSQKNCPSVPKPLIEGGDSLVCGSHLILRFSALLLWQCRRCLWPLAIEKSKLLSAFHFFWRKYHVLFWRRWVQYLSPQMGLVALFINIVNIPKAVPAAM